MADQSGSVNWLRLIQLGQQYMKTWPTKKQLALVFPEHRVIRATRFAVRFMPPLAVFIVCWQIALGDQAGPAVATALFACSLPVQGLWWLGKRSVTPLPPALLRWYHSVHNKLLEAGQAIKPMENKPTYQALAELLRSAFRQLDNTFLDGL